MTDSAARAYGPAQPTTGATVLYTVGVNEQFIIRNIHVCNTTASTATVSLAFNGTSATAANCFLSGYEILPYATYDWSGSLTLDEAETIQALQGTTGALTLIISGVTVTND